MKSKFEVVFLESAIDFIAKLDLKVKKKIYFNLDKAKLENNPNVFKKLMDHIWEFRTLYKGIHYRLFAFWDRTEKEETLVIAPHGMIKKVNKVPKSQIDQATRIRNKYFEELKN